MAYVHAGRKHDRNKIRDKASRILETEHGYVGNHAPASQDPFSGGRSVNPVAVQAARERIGELGQALEQQFKGLAIKVGAEQPLVGRNKK